MKEQNSIASIVNERVGAIEARNINCINDLYQYVYDTKNEIVIDDFKVVISLLLEIVHESQFRVTGWHTEQLLNWKSGPTTPPEHLLRGTLTVLLAQAQHSVMSNDLSLPIDVVEDISISDDTLISEISGLKNRYKDVLAYGGCIFWGQVRACSKKELKGIQGFGELGLKALESIIERQGQCFVGAAESVEDYRALSFKMVSQLRELTTDGVAASYLPNTDNDIHVMDIVAGTSVCDQLKPEQTKELLEYINVLYRFPHSVEESRYISIPKVFLEYLKSL